MQNISNIAQPDTDGGLFAACTSVSLRAVVRVLAQQAARDAFAAAGAAAVPSEKLPIPAP